MNATQQQVADIGFLSKHVYGDKHEAQMRRGLKRDIDLAAILKWSEAKQILHNLAANLLNECISIPPSITISHDHPYADRVAAQISEMGERYCCHPSKSPPSLGNALTKARLSADRALDLSLAIDAAFTGMPEVEPHDFCARDDKTF